MLNFETREIQNSFAEEFVRLVKDEIGATCQTFKITSEYSLVLVTNLETEDELNRCALIAERFN